MGCAKWCATRTTALRLLTPHQTWQLTREQTSAGAYWSYAGVERMVLIPVGVAVVHRNRGVTRSIVAAVLITRA